MDDNEPDIPLNLKSIFDFEFKSNINYSLEVSNIRNMCNSGNIKETFERLQDLLEVNPFVPEFHSLMSKIYFLRKQLYKAEMYALSALFLKKSEKNFLALMKIYKFKRDKKNLIQVISKALELFPEIEKIKKFTKYCK
jgi:tetratricopeptide (TPR) repeat protein